MNLATLKLIEEHFAFATATYGFTVTQTTERPVSIWYQAEDRSFIISYDPMNDAAVDVFLASAVFPERLLLTDLLALTSPAVERRDGVLGQQAFSAELVRLSSLLANNAQTFLRGDVEAFWNACREGVLVQRLRALGREAFFAGDARQAATLFELLRDYWTDADKEVFDRAKRGEKPQTLFGAARRR